MERVLRKKTLLILVVLIMVWVGQQGFSWTLDDPEIKDLGGSLVVRNYEGRAEFSLHILYLNDRSIDYAWGSDWAETVKQTVGDRNCLYLQLHAEQNTYFWPTNMVFVQEPLQYEVGYDDIIKISDTFSGNLRSGVIVSGLVFIPEGIDIYSPMKIYYDDDYTVFSVPKGEEEEPTIEKQIRQLEREKAELEEKISEFKRRITEINQELQEIRN